MGWVGRLFGRSAKRVTDASEWLGATVTPSDLAARSTSAHNRDSTAMVLRATQWVEVCARRNTTVCTGQRLRLYATGKMPASSRVRRVSRERRKALADHRVAGIKAAEYAGDASEVYEVGSHPALELLRNPNPWMLGCELLHHAFYSLELSGNRYWHVVDVGGGMFELYPMAPQWVRVCPSETGTQLVDCYVYGRNGVIETVFDLDEVLHAKFYPSLHSPYYGTGPLAAVVGEADLDSAQLRSELALWNNAARPDWVLPLPQETSAATVQALEARIEQKFRGPSNRGRFLLTTSGEPKPLMWSHREMEYIAGLQNVETRICAAFGVPQSEVKMNEANLASSVTGNRQYLRQTITPRCSLMAEYLTEQVLPLFGEEPGALFFAYDEIVPGDAALTAQTMSVLVGARILTRNEARAELSYEPIDGGDEFESVTWPMLGGDDDEEEDDEEDVKPPPTEAADKRAPKAKRTKRYANDGLNATHRLYADDAAKRILQALNVILPDVSNGREVSVTQLTAALDAAIDSFSFPVLNAGAQDAMADIEDRPDFKPVPELPGYAAEAMRNRSMRIAADIAGNVDAEIKRRLATAIEQGMTRDDAAASIAELLPDTNTSRARVIADTEISRAYIAGNAVVYKEAGVKRLVWDTAYNPCPVCEQAARDWNAKNIGIDDVFDDLVNGKYATADDPRVPQHPNCRCVLLPDYASNYDGGGS